MRDSKSSAKHAPPATYQHTDHLSVRLLTDSSGNSVGTRGHYAYGETWYESGTTTKLKFTTYERDAESGNDYAMAREYINRFGRFSAMDPLSGNNSDPQSLNRYDYALDDPINLTDPSGLHWECIDIKVGGIRTVSCRWRDDPEPLFSSEFVRTYSYWDMMRIWKDMHDGGSLIEKVNDALNYAADRNRCAANNAGSAASALGVSKDNWMGQSLLGNDFSSISQLITGPGRGDAAGQLTMSNPTPLSAVGLTTKAVLDIIPTSGNGIVLAENGAGTLFGVKATTTTLGATAIGKGASKALAVFAAVKLAADGVNYFRALVACSLDPSKN